MSSVFVDETSVARLIGDKELHGKDSGFLFLTAEGRSSAGT
ncbi:hypothetical protein [Alkalicoccus daliensis]|nr:hypothetical protein [Alkalicoccus daliensis]